MKSIRRLRRSGLIVGLSVALGAPAAVLASSEDQFGGLLRARDLTPFGYLRLDMRPAHAINETRTGWALETELAYQNTWALSPQVEKYLTGLSGRRHLGPADVQAIRDLPGENYLVDLELAQLDVTVHYRMTPDWSAYLILSGAHYGGGFLDSTIESFHHSFGFSTFGRTAAARNNRNVILDLKSTQVAELDMPSDTGLLDPTVGVRYSGLKLGDNWHVVLESAVKIPFDGRRAMLSTGRYDFGVQATLQRFARHQALYLNVAAVYFDGSTDIVPSDRQIVPTIIAGYERRVAANTNVILQAYASPSVYSKDETDLDELRGMKYQASLGVRHLWRNSLLSFAITENLQNLNNTPDIGLQLGWTYVRGRRWD